MRPPAALRWHEVEGGVLLLAAEAGKELDVLRCFFDVLGVLDDARNIAVRPPPPRAALLHREGGHAVLEVGLGFLEDAEVPGALDLKGLLAAEDRMQGALGGAAH